MSYRADQGNVPNAKGGGLMAGQCGLTGVDRHAEAIALRNDSWLSLGAIPKWVNPAEVALDRFFTRPMVAEQCYGWLLAAMKKDQADDSHYQFIEPSAGLGTFYDLLPSDRRIGIEIVAGDERFENCDFLRWQPPANGTWAVVGNPPFGHRAWLALAFLNHAAAFADYIGMILPMAFQSDGKGSPKLRVRGAELVATRMLPPNSFVSETGRAITVNALWQIWKRGANRARPIAACDQWVDLFTVDMRKERRCGQRRLAEADWFLQRTFYDDAPSLVRDFTEVKYVCGYGIVIHKEKSKVSGYLKAVDWRKYSNLAAHNCRHVSMYHIRKALADGGFTNA